MNKIKTSAQIAVGLLLTNPTPSSHAEIDVPFSEQDTLHNVDPYFHIEESGVMNKISDQFMSFGNVDLVFHNPVFDVYGSKFKERLVSFSESPSGWNMGVGEPLSYSSLLGLKHFLQHMEVMDPRPAIFMNESGHIVLRFKKTNSESIELEFTGDVVKFIDETKEGENEGEIDLFEVEQIKNLIVAA